MRLVINADDLGISTTVNDAIFSLMENDKITSSTLMAGGLKLEAAAKQSLEHKNKSFGVHLYLTDLEAMTKPDIFIESGLVKESGNFSTSIRNINFSPDLIDSIYKEWEQQVTKIMDAGVQVSHFDSHHHVHTIPGLFKTVIKLQKRFNIRKARTTMNIYDLSKHVPDKKKVISKKIWHLLYKNIYGTKTTDFFTSFSWLYANLTSNSSKNYSLVEAMCHPGSADYQQETNLIETDWQKQLAFPVELISYNQL